MSKTMYKLRIPSRLDASFAVVNAHTLKDLPKCTTFFRVNNQVNRIYG